MAADSTIITWANLGQLQHPDGVRGIAFSPDGQLLATGCRDGVVRLWDPASLRQVGGPRRGHDGGVEGVAFSPNGDRLATSGRDGTVVLWNPSTATGAVIRTLDGHRDTVWGVAFGPDGRTLATTGRDGRLCLWNLSFSPRLRAEHQLHTGALYGVAFSPDGRLLATAGRDMTVRLWDRTAQPIGDPLVGHRDTVWGVAFSPDGRLLASAGRDGTVRLWDPATGQATGSPFGAGPGPLLAATFSPSGDVLVTGGDDGTVRWWDPATGRPVGDPLAAHRGPVVAVAFSPDGSILASSSNDGTVQLWERALFSVAAPVSPSVELPARSRTTTGDPISGEGSASPEQLPGTRQPPDHEPDPGLRQPPEPRSASGQAPGEGRAIPDPMPDRVPDEGGPGMPPTSDGAANVGDPAAAPGGPGGRKGSVASRLDEEQTASGRVAPGDRSASGRSRGAGRSSAVPTPPPSADVAELGLAFGRDQSGPILLPQQAQSSGDDDKRIAPVASDEDQSALRPVPEEAWLGDSPLVGDPLQPVRAAAFSPDGRILAVANGHRVLRVDPVTRRLVGPALSGSGDPVVGVAFSPDGQLVAAVSGGVLWLWDISTGDERRVLYWPVPGLTEAVAISPDGDLLAAAGLDGMVRLWDLPTGSSAREPLDGHNGPVWALAFGPDGGVLASGGEDGTVRLWDPIAGAPVGEPLTGPEGDVRAIVFSPDGRLLAAAGWGGKIWLWDTATWAVVDVLVAEDEGKILGLAFSPDGRLLASATRDDRVQLWDPVSLRAVGGLPAGQSGGGVVAFSADSRLLVATDDDHTLRFWEVPELEISYVHTMACDGASRVDRLGFDREATGLARVLAARATEPPLALALLGDWGSGKSTFMNRMEDLVEGLRAEAAEQVASAWSLDASPYCPGIRQVRFNAWHYAEDRLWAGLIRRLLGELAGHPNVATAESMRADQERTDLDEQIAKLDRDIGRVRAAGWARRVARWLVRDEAVVDSLARGGQAMIEVVTTYKRRRLIALAGLTLVVAGVVAALLLLPGWDTGWWRSAAAAVAVVGGAAGWLAARLTRWSRLVAAFVGPPTPKLAELKAQRANLLHQREILDQEQDPTRRLTRFLQDRHATLDYDPYRGLVSLVHDDLHTLAELIAGQADAWSADPNPEAMPLERVILYIDDLDRCDPATVVDALRAIHLFLALRIFHVVVAVDARWLLRCLRHHYNTLLDDDTETASPSTGSGAAARANGPATAQPALEPNASSPIDYLEKIFQIAYEIPPMGDQVDELVTHLMPLRPGPQSPDSDASAEPDPAQVLPEGDGATPAQVPPASTIPAPPSTTESTDPKSPAPPPPAAEMPPDTPAAPPPSGSSPSPAPSSPSPTATPPAPAVELSSDPPPPLPDDQVVVVAADPPAEVAANASASPTVSPDDQHDAAASPTGSLAGPAGDQDTAAVGPTGSFAGPEGEQGTGPVSPTGSVADPAGDRDAAAVGPTGSTTASGAVAGSSGVGAETAGEAGRPDDAVAGSRGADSLSVAEAGRSDEAVAGTTGAGAVTAGETDGIDGAVAGSSGAVAAGTGDADGTDEAVAGLADANAEPGSEASEASEASAADAADAAVAGSAGSITGLVARRTLDFTPAEVAAVRAAAALLDTPRTVKQLVNVYRVMRATAAPAVLERLENESAYVVVLLAITYGHPLAAPDLFALVDRSGPGSNLRTLLQNPHASASAAADRSAETDALPPVPPAHLADVYIRVLATLDSMGQAAPLDLDIYRYWLARVARYSFRHRKLTTPGPTRRPQAEAHRRPADTTRPAGTPQ